MLRIALLTSALLFASGVAPAADTPAKPARADAVDAALAKAVAGDWRDPKNSARDAHRHPAETLSFFGVRANQHPRRWRLVRRDPGALPARQGALWRCDGRSRSAA